MTDIELDLLNRVLNDDNVNNNVKENLKNLLDDKESNEKELKDYYFQFSIYYEFMNQVRFVTDIDNLQK